LNKILTNILLMVYQSSVYHSMIFLAYELFMSIEKGSNKIRKRVFTNFHDKKMKCFHNTQLSPKSFCRLKLTSVFSTSSIYYYLDYCNLSFTPSISISHYHPLFNICVESIRKYNKIILFFFM
jgi:hypothetical protein